MYGHYLRPWELKNKKDNAGEKNSILPALSF